MANWFSRKETFCILTLLNFFISGSFQRAVADQLNYSAVMAPLYINKIKNPTQWTHLDAMLNDASRMRITAVSVDVWWGLVERKKDHYEWQYYDELFNKISANHLKITPILSFHKCGGGPGDECNIPIPAWVWDTKMGHYTGNDLKYLSETDKVQDDSVSVWATDGMIFLYKDFMREFKNHFKDWVKEFAEINISLGPTGELRYPSYNNGTDYWLYPGRGFFQSYSPLAKDNFQAWVINKKYHSLNQVNLAWGTHYQSKKEILPPGGKLDHPRPAAIDFVENQRLNYINTPYGKDFIAWYNTSLIQHGKKLLETANRVFDGEFSKTPIGMKIPGIHWKVDDPSMPHIAEVTAGLVDTQFKFQDDLGYKPVFDMLEQVQKDFKTRQLIVYFTALEMSDNDIPPYYSKPSALIDNVSTIANRDGLILRGENALGLFGSEGWNNIRSIFSNLHFSGFTFLRLSDEPNKTWSHQKESYSQFINDATGITHANSGR